MSKKIQHEQTMNNIVSNAIQFCDTNIIPNVLMPLLMAGSDNMKHLYKSEYYIIT